MREDLIKFVRRVMSTWFRSPHQRDYAVVLAEALIKEGYRRDNMVERLVAAIKAEQLALAQFDAAVNDNRKKQLYKDWLARRAFIQLLLEQVEKGQTT